jgi:hypothetical protein
MKSDAIFRIIGRTFSRLPSSIHDHPVFDHRTDRTLEEPRWLAPKRKEKRQKTNKKTTEETNTHVLFSAKARFVEISDLSGLNEGSPVLTRFRAKCGCRLSSIGSARRDLLL